MVRYMVERTFPDGLKIPLNSDGATTCLGVVEGNADLGVTWVHSYVSEDLTKTFCIYDGPRPEAIRQAAERNGLPVDRITRVSVLDPYFYRPDVLDVVDRQPDAPGATQTADSR